jgi:hypothetical protein
MIVLILEGSHAGCHRQTLANGFPGNRGPR